MKLLACVQVLEDKRNMRLSAPSSRTVAEIDAELDKADRQFSLQEGWMLKMEQSKVTFGVRVEVFEFGVWFQLYLGPLAGEGDCCLETLVSQKLECRCVQIVSGLKYMC